MLSTTYNNIDLSEKVDFDAEFVYKTQWSNFSCGPPHHEILSRITGPTQSV